MKFRQKIKVEFEYNIYFIAEMFGGNNKIFREIFNSKSSKVAVFMDSGVASKHPHTEKNIKEWFAKNPWRGELILPFIKIAGGEGCKNDGKVQVKIAEALRKNRLDRHSFVIIIGGGAVLDTVGYISSITHRGIRQIRIPTTVLSQCDSGVGVKNGINYFGAKNYFGTFTPPYAVINDFSFLKSLDRRDILSGVAEAFKVAIIKDKSFLDFLTSSAEKFKKPGGRIVEQMIMRSAKLHADHIALGNDPFEMGSSRPLDFGHWSAHAIENLTGYALRHGEAVALGVTLDMIIAKNKGFITRNEFEQVYNGLKASGLAMWNPVVEKREKNGSLSICRGLEEFRQHIGGELHLIMPDGLGKKRIIGSLEKNEIEKAVMEMKDEDRKQ
jgi:3-dehydroquinate synthase